MLGSNRRSNGGGCALGLGHHHLLAGMYMGFELGQPVLERLDFLGLLLDQRAVLLFNRKQPVEAPKPVYPGGGFRAIT